LLKINGVSTLEILDRLIKTNQDTESLQLLAQFLTRLNSYYFTNIALNARLQTVSEILMYPSDLETHEIEEAKKYVDECIEMISSLD
jgi:hypothetical protein